MSTGTPSIPRLAFGLWMAAATLLALALTWGTAIWVAHGTPLEPSGHASARAALIALLVGSLATFAPALMRISHDHWGLAVLLAGVTRGLLALAVAFMLSQASTGLEPRPLFLGVCSGAVLLLIVETAAAISILARIERARAADPAAGNPTPSTTA